MKTILTVALMGVSSAAFCQTDHMTSELGRIITPQSGATKWDDRASPDAHNMVMFYDVDCSDRRVIAASLHGHNSAACDKGSEAQHTRMQSRKP
jgi:hypothetical protein